MMEHTISVFCYSFLTHNPHTQRKIISLYIECSRIVVLEKTLESPLGCIVVKPANTKEISPEYSLKGLMLKLILQYFGHLMQRVISRKDPDAGKD